MTDALASVIILGWGGEPYIAACLEALRRQTYPAVEVLVVDNGSPDRTAEIVKIDYPEVKLVHTGRNLGVAGGNNVGLKAARGDILALINADVEVAPDWLERLVRAMAADPTIGIAGAKLLYPDGTIQFAGGRATAPQGYITHLGWHEPDRGQWDVAGDVELVTGATLAITRQALERIGYEDEKFFPIDYEDADMSYRARAAGFRVVLVPQATAVHRESSTAGAALPTRMLALEAGRIRFVCKHWPAQRLQGEFLPAELDYVRSTAPLNRNALRWVYLKALHEIDDLACWRERLGGGDRAQSTTMLAEMLTQLRRACVPDISAGSPAGRVAQMVEAWFAPDSATRYPLHLALYRMDGRTEPHQPIAWPDWPPGLWPKVVALSKKVVRRLLSWYITPIVEQQNAVNAVLLYAAETLAREVASLQEKASRSSAEDS
ncbi:MAG: glycosyltransferase family 2 protein [Anaerolineae bacterium]|nr:glycosyltransferase family 2 protein [Anaerolineae bacterium]